MAAAGHHVTSVALHPGTIATTNLVRHISLSWVVSAVSGLWKHKGGMEIALREPKKTIEQGAATTLYAALSPDVVSGGYYADSRREERALHKQALNVELARQLWDMSERWVAGELAVAPSVAAAVGAVQARTLLVLIR